MTRYCMLIQRHILCALLLFTSAASAAKKDYQSPQKYLLERSYSVKNKSDTQAFRIKVYIPDVQSYQNATLLKATYSIEPAERTQLMNGAEQLMFDLEMAPREEKVIHLQWEIQLAGINALAQTNQLVLSAEDRQRYLEAGTLYESDNPEIIAKTNAVIAEKATELEKAEAIFAFVRSHVKFFRFGADSKGALYALQNGKGDCTEYAALIVAMSRAAGIPARLNGVMAFNKADTGKAGTDNHNHAEVFITGHGWVPAEATFKSLAFGQMANFEVILRRGLRTDKNGWVSWKVASEAAKIKEVKMLGHKWQKLP